MVDLISPLEKLDCRRCPFQGMTLTDSLDIPWHAMQCKMPFLYKSISFKSLSASNGQIKKGLGTLFWALYQIDSHFVFVT